MNQLGKLSQIHGEKCWPTVEKLSPCEEACPLCTDIPSYVIAISRGMLREALEIVRETNPFPSVCGRVCHHPCEDACNRAIIDKPIAIQWLKRLVADQVVEEKPAPVERLYKEKVAIIGSGPAGLTAAYDLVRRGYGVTVYEALPVAGGMLATGVPQFVLPNQIVEAEIDYIRALGVDIRTSTAIGDLDYLRSRGFNAILIATGAQKSAELRIPGAHLESVLLALPFLRRVKLGEKIVLRGKVVVIGGGNVAMDAARTALRLGANEVHAACLEARKDMPAYSWEIEAAEREGVRLHPSLAPEQFGSRDGARVGFVKFNRVASTQIDEVGRITWTLTEGPGSEYSMEGVDTVIIAIGQAPDVALDDELRSTPRGGLMVDPDSLLTTIPGVFAAGDAVAVAGSVVESIAAGHRAAEAIDHYLKGGEPKPKSVSETGVAKIEPEMVPPFLVKKERWEMPALPPRDAIRGFGEAKLGYAVWEGIEEAKRCLNCRMCASCIFERGQVCFENAMRIL